MNGAGQLVEPQVSGRASDRPDKSTDKSTLSPCLLPPSTNPSCLLKMRWSLIGKALSEGPFCATFILC